MNRKPHHAFTLIEIILVVVIIGILAALTLPRLMGQTDKARINTAKAQVASFKTAIARFEQEIQRYPTTGEGLKALVEKPLGLPDGVKWERYLDDRTIPRDPWNRDYIYRCPGTINTDGYDLLSTGPDGKEGTDDDIGDKR